MRKWKRKLLASHGLVIEGKNYQHQVCRLYARSLRDMIEFLITEPGAMGFQLSASQKNIDNVFRKQTYAHGICWCFNGNIKWPQQTQILGQNIGG